MDFSTETNGDIKVVKAAGRIDHATAEAFAAALEPHIADCRAGNPPLVLDFSGVDYISSVGLRALMVASRRISAQGGKFGIASLQPLVQEVFTISRFNLVMPCFADLAAAREALA